MSKARLFKWRHFLPAIIIRCVRWYCRYSLSYRDVEELSAERGWRVDHSTIYRWIQAYSPDLLQEIEGALSVKVSELRVVLQKQEQQVVG